MKDNKLIIGLGFTFVVIISILCICIVIGIFSWTYSSIDTENRSEKESGIEDKQKTILNIIAYNETYPEYRNIESVPDEIDINAILKITPPIDGKNIFVTDRFGRLELEVKAGNYSIEPIHNSEDYLVEVDIKEGEEKTTEIQTQNALIYYYKLNVGDKTSLISNLDYRRALAHMVDKDINSQESADYILPAANLIPTTYNIDGWADTAKNFPENNIAITNELLRDFEQSNLIITLNNPTIDENDAVEFTRYENNVEKINQIDVIPNEWFDYLDIIKEKNYEIANAGWYLDSNNILEFYKEEFGQDNDKGYISYDVFELIDLGESALEDGSIAEYERAIIEINNRIVEDLPIIPISWTSLENRLYN